MPTVTVSSTLATGRRRAGKKWTKDPQTVEVTAEELKVLKADPYLVVKAAEPDDLTAKELIEKIKTMTDVAALGDLFKGETRSTVKDALKARIKELKDAAK